MKVKYWRYARAKSISVKCCKPANLCILFVSIWQLHCYWYSRFRISSQVEFGFEFAMNTCYFFLFFGWIGIFRAWKLFFTKRSPSFTMLQVIPSGDCMISRSVMFRLFRVSWEALFIFPLSCIVAFHPMSVLLHNQCTTCGILYFQLAMHFGRFHSPFVLGAGNLPMMKVICL